LTETVKEPQAKGDKFQNILNMNSKLLKSKCSKHEFQRSLKLKSGNIKDDICQLILKKILGGEGNQHSVPLGKLYIMLPKSELKVMGYIKLWATFQYFMFTAKHKNLGQCVPRLTVRLCIKVSNCVQSC